MLGHDFGVGLLFVELAEEGDGVHVCVCVCVCVCALLPFCTTFADDAWRKLEQSSHLTHGVAWMIAARELYAPISCILLVMHHQMFQECSPIIQTLDKPRELSTMGGFNALSQPSSHGEPWPDAEPWQGQDSQLSLTPTQGVNPFTA